MLKLLAIISLFISPLNNLKANDDYTFTPPKNYNVEGTYSSEMEQGNSFHLVIMKVKGEKVYKIQPVHVKSDGTINEFELVTLTYEPQIVSHHEGDALISFINFNQDAKKLTVFDFNTSNLSVNTTSRGIGLKALNTVIRLKDKTVILNLDDNKTFSTIVIEGKNSLEKKYHTVPKEYEPAFKEIIKDGVEAINQNEFNEKGSIHKNKVFVNDNELSIIINDEKEVSTQIFKTLLSENGTLKVINIDPAKESALEKIKEYNTYLHNNQIFSVASNKNLMEVFAFDASNGKLVKKIAVDAILNNSEVLRDYLKSTSTIRMKSTITVNNTAEGNIVLRLDQADKKTYKYNYNWWWHHNWIMQHNMMMHQQWMHQQMQQQIQQMNYNIPNRFGPDVASYENQYLDFEIKKEREAIKIVLDKATLSFIPDANSKTSMNEVDREKHLKPFEKDNNKRNLSATFSKNAMHCIYQDRTSKEIRIQIKTLD